MEHPGCSGRAKPDSLQDACQHSACDTNLLPLCIEFIFAGEEKLVGVGAWERGKWAGNVIGFAVREGSPYPECLGFDVPWYHAMLLLPICIAAVSVVGAGLALKHVLDLLGFFALWSIADMVVMGFRPPAWAGINTAHTGFLCGLCFSRKTWGEKMPFKENYCIAYQLKTKVFCPVNHLEALSCQSGDCLLFT